MSTMDRLKAIEAILGGRTPMAADGHPIAVYFAVFCSLGPASRPDLESYCIYGWTGIEPIAPDVSGWQCNMPASHLTKLAGQGYQVILLHDPEHPYDTWIGPEPVFPVYTKQHVTSWAGYVPGTFLGELLAKQQDREV